MPAGHGTRPVSACGMATRASHWLVETAQTETDAQTFVRRYRRTGTGWWGTPGQAGQVRWVRFTSPDAAARLRVLAGGEADRDA